MNLLPLPYEVRLHKVHHLENCHSIENLMLIYHIPENLKLREAPLILFIIPLDGHQDDSQILLLPVGQICPCCQSQLVNLTEVHQ